MFSYYFYLFKLYNFNNNVQVDNVHGVGAGQDLLRVRVSEDTFLFSSCPNVEKDLQFS